MFLGQIQIINILNNYWWKVKTHNCCSLNLPMFCFFILPLHHIYLITLVSRYFADSDYSVLTCNQSDCCGWNAEWVTTDKSSSFSKFCLLETGQEQKKNGKNKQKFLIWQSAKLMIGRSLLYLLEFVSCESQQEPCRNHIRILSQTQSEVALNQIGGLPLLTVPLRYIGCCDRLHPTAQIWIFYLRHFTKSVFSFKPSYSLVTKG